MVSIHKKRLASCIAHLAGQDGPGFMLLSLPNTANYILVFQCTSTVSGNNLGVYGLNSKNPSAIQHQRSNAGRQLPQFVQSRETKAANQCSTNIFRHFIVRFCTTRSCSFSAGTNHFQQTCHTTGFEIRVRNYFSLCLTSQTEKNISNKSCTS
jgi:hypothetical protein